MSGDVERGGKSCDDTQSGGGFDRMRGKAGALLPGDIIPAMMERQGAGAQAGSAEAARRQQVHVRAYLEKSTVPRARERGRGAERQNTEAGKRCYLCFTAWKLSPVAALGTVVYVAGFDSLSLSERRGGACSARLSKLPGLLPEVLKGESLYFERGF